MEDLRRDLRNLIETHRAELLAIPGVRDARLSASSNDIILEVDAETPEDKMTWFEREGRRVLGHPMVAIRRSR